MTVKFANSSVAYRALPVTVASRVGNGNWVATSVAGNTATLSLPSGTTTFGVAYVCPFDYNNVVNEFIFEASLSDGAAYTVECPNVVTRGAFSNVILSGDVAAIPGATYASIASQLAPWNIWSTSFTNVQMQFPNGNNDIAVSANTGSSYLPSAIKIIRNQAVPGAINGGNPITLAPTDETTSETVTMPTPPAGFQINPSVAAYYVTTNSARIDLGGNNSGASTYAVVPTSESQPGDHYEFSAEADSTGYVQQQGEYLLQFLTASEESTAPGAVAFAWPTPLTPNVPTAAALPTFQIVYPGGFSGSTQVSSTAQISWLDSNVINYQRVSMTATSAYLNGSTSLSIPDLSSIPGFIVPATSGTQVGWDEIVTGGTYPSFSVAPLNGSETTTSARGLYTVP